jgi:hypothetical protein
MVPGGPVRVATPAPDAATIDPTRKFPYLGSISCSATYSCGLVSILAIDAISGAVTVTASNPEVEVGSSLTFNPSGNFAYLLTYGGTFGGILVLKMDPSTGALALVPGSGGS